jgi:hypothetical protein
VTEARKVSQEKKPCVLHASHSPITVINEEHHWVPQAWQLAVWREVRLGPDPICATSHNSYHEALRRVVNHHEPVPSWCRGRMREEILRAVIWHAENGPALRAP